MDLGMVLHPQLGEDDAELGGDAFRRPREGGRSEVFGDGTTADKAMVRAGTQFVGRAALDDGGNEAFQWRHIAYVEVDAEGSTADRFAAVSGPVEGPGRMRGIRFTSNLQQWNGDYYGNPSQTQRIIAHEAIYHTAMNKYSAAWENWVSHDLIDLAARIFIKRHGLNGVNCPRAANFPSC